MEVLPLRVPARPDDDADVLTVAQAAARLGVSESAVYKQLGSGSFPVRAVKVGRVWRVVRADLDRFLAVEDGVEAP